ncbi:hypothetical protein HDU93_008121 [Gonapodya sp. JEL0774]|nr:hypothetical protein HDU93_008121 [Gonapodya sp. JEL0774]
MSAVSNKRQKSFEDLPSFTALADSVKHGPRSATAPGTSAPSALSASRPPGSVCRPKDPPDKSGVQVEQPQKMNGGQRQIPSNFNSQVSLPLPPLPSSTSPPTPVARSTVPSTHSPPSALIPSAPSVRNLYRHTLRIDATNGPSYPLHHGRPHLHPRPDGFRRVRVAFRWPDNVRLARPLPLGTDVRHLVKVSEVPVAGGVGASRDMLDDTTEVPNRSEGGGVDFDELERIESSALETSKSLMSQQPCLVENGDTVTLQTTARLRATQGLWTQPSDIPIDGACPSQVPELDASLSFVSSSPRSTQSVSESSLSVSDSSSISLNSAVPTKAHEAVQQKGHLTFERALDSELSDSKPTSQSEHFSAIPPRDTMVDLTLKSNSECNPLAENLLVDTQESTLTDERAADTTDGSVPLRGSSSLRMSTDGARINSRRTSVDVVQLLQTSLAKSSSLPGDRADASVFGYSHNFANPQYPISNFAEKHLDSPKHVSLHETFDSAASDLSSAPPLNLQSSVVDPSLPLQLERTLDFSTLNKFDALLDAISQRLNTARAELTTAGDELVRTRNADAHDATSKRRRSTPVGRHASSSNAHSIGHGEHKKKRRSTHHGGDGTLFGGPLNVSRTDSCCTASRVEEVPEKDGDETLQAGALIFIDREASSGSRVVGGTTEKLQKERSGQAFGDHQIWIPGVNLVDGETPLEVDTQGDADSSTLQGPSAKPYAQSNICTETLSSVAKEYPTDFCDVEGADPAPQRSWLGKLGSQRNGNDSIQMHSTENTPVIMESFEEVPLCNSPVIGDHHHCDVIHDVPKLNEEPIDVVIESTESPVSTTLKLSDVTSSSNDLPFDLAVDSAVPKSTNEDIDNVKPAIRNCNVSSNARTTISSGFSVGVCDSPTRSSNKSVSDVIRAAAENGPKPGSADKMICADEVLRTESSGKDMEVFTNYQAEAKTTGIEDEDLVYYPDNTASAHFNHDSADGNGTKENPDTSKADTGVPQQAVEQCLVAATAVVSKDGLHGSIPALKSPCEKVFEQQDPNWTIYHEMDIEREARLPERAVDKNTPDIVLNAGSLTEVVSQSTVLPPIEKIRPDLAAWRTSMLQPDEETAKVEEMLQGMRAWAEESRNQSGVDPGYALRDEENQQRMQAMCEGTETTGHRIVAPSSMAGTQAGIQLAGPDTEMRSSSIVDASAKDPETPDACIAIPRRVDNIAADTTNAGLSLPGTVSHIADVLQPGVPRLKLTQGAAAATPNTQDGMQIIPQETLIATDGGEYSRGECLSSIANEAFTTTERLDPLEFVSDRFREDHVMDPVEKELQDITTPFQRPRKHSNHNAEEEALSAGFEMIQRIQDGDISASSNLELQPDYGRTNHHNLPNANLRVVKDEEQVIASTLNQTMAVQVEQVVNNLRLEMRASQDVAELEMSRGEDVQSSDIEAVSEAKAVDSKPDQNEASGRSSTIPLNVPEQAEPGASKCAGDIDLELSEQMQPTVEGCTTLQKVESRGSPSSSVELLYVMEPVCGVIESRNATSASEQECADQERPKEASNNANMNENYQVQTSNIVKQNTFIVEEESLRLSLGSHVGPVETFSVITPNIAPSLRAGPVAVSQSVALTAPPKQVDCVDPSIAPIVPACAPISLVGELSAHAEAVRPSNHLHEISSCDSPQPSHQYVKTSSLSADLTQSLASVVTNTLGIEDAREGGLIVTEEIAQLSGSPVNYLHDYSPDNSVCRAQLVTHTSTMAPTDTTRIKTESEELSTNVRQASAQSDPQYLSTAFSGPVTHSDNMDRRPGHNNEGLNNKSQTISSNSVDVISQIATEHPAAALVDNVMAGHSERSDVAHTMTCDVILLTSSRKKAEDVCLSKFDDSIGDRPEQELPEFDSLSPPNVNLIDSANGLEGKNGASSGGDCGNQVDLPINGEDLVSLKAAGPGSIPPHETAPLTGDDNAPPEATEFVRISVGESPIDGALSMLDSVLASPSRPGQSTLSAIEIENTPNLPLPQVIVPGGTMPVESPSENENIALGPSTNLPGNVHLPVLPSISTPADEVVPNSPPLALDASSPVTPVEMNPISRQPSTRSDAVMKISGRMKEGDCTLTIVERSIEAISDRKGDGTTIKLKKFAIDIPYGGSRNVKSKREEKEPVSSNHVALKLIGGFETELRTRTRVIDGDANRSNKSLLPVRKSISKSDSKGDSATARKFCDKYLKAIWDDYGFTVEYSAAPSSNTTAAPSSARSETEDPLYTNASVTSFNPPSGNTPTPPNRMTPTFNSFDEYTTNALLSSSGNFDLAALDRFDKLDTKFEIDMWDKRKWKLVRVAEDGNCFWRCLAFWIWQDTSLYSRARSLVLRHMLHHPSTYSPFLLDSEPYSTYCARKSREHQYANHVELQASANYFGRTVEVWTYPGWGGAGDDGLMMWLEGCMVEQEKAEGGGDDAVESTVEADIGMEEAQVPAVAVPPGTPPLSVMAWTPDSPLPGPLEASSSQVPSTSQVEFAGLEEGQDTIRYRYYDAGAMGGDGVVRVAYQRNNHYNILRPGLLGEPAPTLEFGSTALVKGAVETGGGSGAWSAWRRKSSANSSDRDLQEAIRLSMLEQTPHSSARPPSNRSSLSPSPSPRTAPFHPSPLHPSHHHPNGSNSTSSSSLLNPGSRRHSTSTSRTASGTAATSYPPRHGGEDRHIAEGSVSPGKVGAVRGPSEGEIFSMEP